MRKSTPILLWLVINIFATLLPLGVSLTEDFSVNFNIFQRLTFCILVTFPSLYGILIIFSYYRELSKGESVDKAEDIADIDLGFDGRKTRLGQLDNNIDVTLKSIQLHLGDVAGTQKRDFVWGLFVFIKVAKLETLKPLIF